MSNISPLFVLFTFWISNSMSFTKIIPLNELENREQYKPEMLNENLMFGTPDEIIKKLKLYEKLGVDEFIYYATFGLGHEEQQKSIDLFIEEVMPEFLY